MPTPNNTSGLVTNPRMKLVLSDLAHFCYSPSANYNNRGSSAWHTVVGCGATDMPPSAGGKCTYAPSTWYRHAGIALFWWNGRGPDGATVDDMKIPLLRAGMVPVWWGTGQQANQLQPSQLRPGDIASMLSSNSAHGAMWTGYEWRSDFCQGLKVYPYGNNVGRGGNQTFILWRHPDLQEPGMSVNGAGFSMPSANMSSNLTGGIFGWMFRGFAGSMYAGGTGDMPRWQKAVTDMQKWYGANISNYSQGIGKWAGLPTWTECPLLGGEKVRHDCSGFVTSCLKLYGIKWPYPTMIPVRADCMDQSALKIMQDGGFTWIEIHSMEEFKQTVQPFDIMVGPGHTEIYAGDGKSFTWGPSGAKHGGFWNTSWHPGKAPFYNSIFRCNGTGGSWQTGYGNTLYLSDEELLKQLEEQCPRDIDFKGLWMRYHLQAGLRSPIIMSIVLSHAGFSGTVSGFGGPMGEAGESVIDMSGVPDIKQDEVLRGVYIAQRLSQLMGINLMQACGCVGYMCKESHLATGAYNKEEAARANNAGYAGGINHGEGIAQWTGIVYKTENLKVIGMPAGTSISSLTLDQQIEMYAKGDLGQGCLKRGLAQAATLDAAVCVACLEGHGSGSATKAYNAVNGDINSPQYVQLTLASYSAGRKDIQRARKWGGQVFAACQSGAQGTPS